jgi:hypothetical protein
MKKPAVILATALSTVALAGAVGVGVASADPTTSPTPTATAAPTAGQTAAKPDRQAQKADRKGKRDLVQRALHGEVVLGGKKHRVVDFQRGEVTAVSGTSVTVKSKDGFSATYVVDAKTKVRQAKEQAAIGDVKTGDKVRVIATKDGSTLTANRIADRTK